jgi:hypothetical protein
MLEHAAHAAEASEQQTVDVIDEIKLNTECTLRILEHVKSGS